MPSVKALIQNDYNSDSSNVKAALLFGHVPVPYSGSTAWDGHVPQHQGAWASDTYYGVMGGSWTDSSVNIPSGPTYIENFNVPGDGKFDQSTIPADAVLAVGRVDLANLPSFSKSEQELLRQYLNKDHNFRHRVFTAQRRGLLHDDFGVFSGEAFASSGWCAFAPMFGASNINEVGGGATFSTLSSQSYLFTYGCGPGTVNTCQGVGQTSDFANNDPQTVFTMFFGSYFGDFDKSDNFLRAPLATPSYTLTSCWSGRPHWYLHRMAMGDIIGNSAILTQNNSGTYWPGKSGSRGTDIALMGDPTLRLHPVIPPSNFTASAGSSGNNLSWNASSDSAIAGYHVYRASSSAGQFSRLTGSPINATSFVDSTGNYTYMVRAIKLELCNSGSYFNPSQGVFASLGSQPPPPPPPPPQAVALPAKIQAEDYRVGGEGTGYHDSTSGNTGGAYKNDDVDIEATADAGGGYDVGWTTAGEWLAYDVSSASASSYDFTLRVASQTAGQTMHLEIDGANVSGSLAVPNTGGWQTWQDLTASKINVGAGTHVLKAVFDTGTVNLNYINIVVSAASSATVAIPAKIEAEDYRTGGEGVGYHDSTTGNTGTKYRNDDVDIEPTTDTGGGFDVAWTTSGEWLAYNISNNASAGFDIALRVATGAGASQVHVEIDGANVSGTIVAPSTGGWQNWTTISAGNVTISAGNHVLKVVFDGPNVNLNYINITTSSSSTAGNIPGKIEAEDYRGGGEGVGYHDTTAGNSGTKYRNDDVDIEATTDAGGGFDVGWTAPGEWLAYNVFNSGGGTFDVALRVATTGTQAVHLEVDGSNVSGPIAIPNTGGWQTWTDVTAHNISVASGSHILKVVFETGNTNLNYLNVTTAGSSLLSTSTNVLPSKIEAEDYMSGGEGVGYHDTTSANIGARYRNDGVDIESTTDAGGGYDVCYIDAGEWLAYNVTANSAATYTFTLRVAAIVAGQKVHIEIDGANVSGSMSVPNTGGWQNWIDLNTPAISVSGGNHVMKVVFETSAGMNLNYINIH